MFGSVDLFAAHLYPGWMVKHTCVVIMKIKPMYVLILEDLLSYHHKM